MIKKKIRKSKIFLFFAVKASNVSRETYKK
nr:MAG TPA: hypothetical protein [Caudoviricetes sp.]